MYHLGFVYFMNMMGNVSFKLIHPVYDCPVRTANETVIDKAGYVAFSFINQRDMLLLSFLCGWMYV